MADTYEVERNGEVYEVEAESPEMAAKAVEYMTSRGSDAAALRAAQKDAATRSGRGVVTQALPRLIENFQQLLALGSELIGNEGAVKEQTDKMNMRRLAASEGDPVFEEGADLGELATLILPAGTAGRAGGVAAGVMKPLKEATSMSRALLRTGKDALYAGALAQGASETAKTPGDVLAARATGAAFAGAPGAVAQGIVGIRPAMASFAYRMARNADTNDALQKELGNMLKGSMPLPVSLQSGSKTFAAFERQVQKTKAQNYFNRLFEDFADTLEPYINSMGRIRDRMAASAARKAGKPVPGPGGGDSLEIALGIQKAWKANVRSTQAAASKLYGQRLSNAIADAAADPNKYPIPFQNAAAVAKKWAGESGKPWWTVAAPGAEKATGALAELDGHFTRLVEAGLPPNQSVPELITMRANLRAMDQQYWDEIQNAGKAPDQKLMNKHRALNQMIEAVDADIDAFIKANPPVGPGGHRPAVAALLELRAANKDYKAFKDVRQDMYQSATSQLFGFDLPADKTKALVDIAKMEPAEQRILAQVLRNHDPAVLADLRYTLLNNAFEELTSGAGRTATRGKVDPKIWEQAILGHNNMPFGQELFSPAQNAMLKRSLSSVRVLTGTTEGKVDPNTAISLESALMAGATWAAAFVSRAIFRIAGSGRLEDLLLTEAGLKSLTTLEDVYKGRGKWTSPEVRKALQDLESIAMAPEISYEEEQTGE